jgi:hypothetical protein
MLYIPCMYVRMYVHMYVRMYVRTYECTAFNGEELSFERSRLIIAHY